MNWSALAAAGAEALVEIVTKYIVSSAAQRVEMYAQADADTQKVFDLVDGHLLDNNAKIDKLAAKKFGDGVALGDVVSEATAPITAADVMSVEPVK